MEVIEKKDKYDYFDYDINAGIIIIIAIIMLFLCGRRNERRPRRCYVIGYVICEN